MLTNRPQNGQGLGLGIVEITTPELFAGISLKATVENHFKVAKELAKKILAEEEKETNSAP